MKMLLYFLILMVTCMDAKAQGYFFEYKMSVPNNAHSEAGFYKTYAQDGNTRVEMDMSLPGMGATTRVSLTLKSSPNTVFSLDPKSKTYFETQIDRIAHESNHTQQDYELNIIGKEKLNGYNCTHVLIRQANRQQGMEMWLTKDISGFAEMARVKTEYTGENGLIAAMNAKGVSGFPVRIKSSEGGQSMQMDLVTAERRNNPESLFSLSGYTKRASPTMGGSGNQEMMEKLKNMSPQEREEWMKKMKEQYGEH